MISLIMGVFSDWCFKNGETQNNFTIDDANRIFAVNGYKIDYDIKPL